MAKAVSKALRRATPLGLTPMALSLAACGSGGEDSSSSSNNDIDVPSMGDSEGGSGGAIYHFEVDKAQGNGFTTIQGMEVFDLNGDDKKEVILSYQAYPFDPYFFPEMEWHILTFDGEIVSDLNQSVFDPAISSQATRQFAFIDIDGDGDLDILAGDVGWDRDPWTGGGIIVAVNNAGFYDVITDQITSGYEEIRLYAFAAGQLDDDPNIEILAGDFYDALDLYEENGLGVILDVFYSDGQIQLSSDINHPISNLSNAQFIGIDDFDGDGLNDIILGGNWTTNNVTIYFSGLQANDGTILPESILGHVDLFKFQNGQSAVGSDTDIVIFADYDNDGDLDVVSVGAGIEVSKDVDGNFSAKFIGIESAINIIEQTNPREFNSVLQVDFSASLGDQYFMKGQNYDLNSDGLMDFVLHKWTFSDLAGGVNAFSSVFFINKGEMQFEKIESIEIKSINPLAAGMYIPIGYSIDGSVEVMIVDQKMDGPHWVDDLYVESQIAVLTFNEGEILIN